MLLLLSTRHHCFSTARLRYLALLLTELTTIASSAHRFLFGYLRPLLFSHPRPSNSVAMSAIVDAIKASAVGQAVSHFIDTTLNHDNDATANGQSLDLSDEAAVSRFQEFLRIPTMTIEGSTSQRTHTRQQ